MGNCNKNAGGSHKTTAPATGMLNTNMVHERTGDVLTKYEVIRTIGEGSMGAFSKARIKDHKKGGSAYNPEPQNVTQMFTHGSESVQLKPEGRRQASVYYALKTIQLARVTPEFIDELRNEIALLKSMDHPNIVKAYEVYERKTQIYIVMELCSGGDLYKRLPYTEKDAAKISDQLLSAIRYMHDNNIVHRDLKFENIMFENNSPDAEIKVIDFGLSRKFLPDDRYMTEGVGTFYTMAPQVLQGVYTSQADLWSCGVISFMLLSSVKPFHHKNRSRLVDKIMRAEYSFEGIVWEMISDDAKDFVANLLVLDPKKRMTAAMALEHPWFHHKFNLEDRRPSEEIMDGVAHNLLKYKYTSELKKVALNVIAHKSSTEEIVELRKAFDQYDSTNDGIIAYDEFKSALASSHLKEEDFRTIFESVDVNHNGVINYTEFLAATLEVKGYIEEERIAEAFERMDTDHDGYITRENLARLLGGGYTPQRADALIKEADTNKDGKLSFQEFLAHFRKTTTEMNRSASHLESSHNECSHELLGVDAVIPGGKYDPEKHGK